VGARLANMRQGERTDLSSIGEKLSQPESANLFNIGKRSVERAKKVLTSGTPELAQAVEGGKIAVSLAAMARNPSRRLANPLPAGVRPQVTQELSIFLSFAS